MDVAPISMVLTTLAAQFYNGHWSVSESMTTILDRVENAINSAMPERIYVLNPANLEEDLSERWDDQEQYAAFVEGIASLRTTWKRLTADQSLEKSFGVLEELAGEPTKEAFRKQARDLNAARGSDAVKVRSAGAISIVSGGSIRPNTFHGER
jgi:hypothetical protein